MRKHRTALLLGPIARHPGQGRSLLYNAVVLPDDGGQLLPDGWAVFPAAAYTTAA